jgi:hypothetical protein
LREESGTTDKKGEFASFMKVAMRLQKQEFVYRERQMLALMNR